MAPPDPSSPSASSALLPFLNGKPRRGSLASITSRAEIDKDALSQALDVIHISASKSGGLTSFHDYDGGVSRGGPKELVSGGVSGLYNKLRHSVGSPSAKESKETKFRHLKSASGTSLSATDSRSPDSAAASRSIVSLSQIVTPKVADSEATSHRLSFDPTSSVDVDINDTQLSTSHLIRADDKAAHPHVSQPLVSTTLEGHSKHTGWAQDVQDAQSREDVERAQNMRIDNRNEDASETLSRMLSHRESQIPDESKQLVPKVSGTTEHAIEESDSSDGSHSHVRQRSTKHDVHHKPKGSILKTGNDSQASTSGRPRLPRAGISHLPGFEPSRTSSFAEDGDADSLDSSQTSSRPPALEFSPNINSGLQRRRTGLKITSSAAQPGSVPSHLKRRILSKEFWMQDANAKVCFSCGQTFSTFRRKHHCRTCGQIFDASCTSLVAGTPFGQPGTVRLCRPCEDIIFGSDDDDDSTVLSDDGEEHARSPRAHYSPRAEDGMLPHVDGSGFSRMDTEVATPSIGIPASRRNREAKRRSAVIEFDSHPALARPSSSHSLLSLSRRPRSSSHRRRQSRHQPGRVLRATLEDRVPFQQEGDPGRKVSLPAFHFDNVIDPDLAPFLSDEGSDNDDPQPSILSVVSGGHAASPHEREKLGFASLFSSALKKGRSRLGEKETTASSLRSLKHDETAPQLYRQSAKLSSKIRPRSQSNLLTTMESIPDNLNQVNSPPRKPAVTTTKVVPSSDLRASNLPSVKLRPAALEHMQNFLAQSIRDANIPMSKSWEKALLPILLRCTEDVEPDVQRGDDMDIRHYIKLKKVPGARPADSSYVSGIVFSKNIALKTMARSISQPRIAIVTFAIEYARYEKHFMSLGPVIAQEQEYLQNLVSRIAALRPHVLLVQRHVSGLALRLLEDAGITVAYNIKESVLAAVARVTQTTMIKSIDKLGLDPSHLGRCDSFDVKTYLADGSRKTYIFLSGCEPDLGCTIVLRGTDTKTLRKVKRLTEFMCYVAYNLKLEDSLLHDELALLPLTAARSQLSCVNSCGLHQNDTLDKSEPACKALGHATAFKYDKLEQETRSKLLSASPFVTFMQPYLLTQLRELEQKLATYTMLRDQYAAADEDGEDEIASSVKDFELVKPEMVHAPASKDQPKAIREYLHAVHEAQLEKATFTYQTQERQWEAFIKGDVDPYDPFWHQKIVVLFSVVSTLTSAPCSGPDLLAISYYAGYGRAQEDQDEDIPLGQYVEDLCDSANTTCKDCSKKYYEHHRQYVHGFGQLSVTTQRQPASAHTHNDAILMWSTCRLCRFETPVTQMSEHAWKYSFAKYLEISFWSNPLRPSVGSCEHDIHKNYLRFFGFREWAVRFQYDTIDIYDVVVPRAMVTWKVEADLVMKNEQYIQVEQRLTSFTESIKKRLDSINVDTLDEKRAAEAHDLLGELHERADNDHEILLKKLQQRYGSSRYYELIPFNRALRLMDEKAIAWDDTFNSFERDYFPSETDIRKLASIQLRNMFLESEPQSASVAGGDSDLEDGTEMLSMSRTAQGHQRSSVSEEMAEEKANGVLSSVVEDHKASVDENSNSKFPEDVIGVDKDHAHHIAHVHDHEEAVERNDVKHLDLAVSSWSSNDGPVTEGVSLDEVLSSSTFTAQNSSTTNEPFATQPKPLSSGLLERIEQIRSSRPAEEIQNAESRIPTLADLKKRDTASIAVPSSPRLLRAKSQPSNIPRLGDNLSTSPTLEHDGDDQQSEEPPPQEKRLGDRLRMSRLALRVGKVAPSLIPRSIPHKSDDHSSSHVSALAKHFEMMSREFEKERLRERKQRALRSRQARANPLASSQPVVEVYQNATDAVGENAQLSEPFAQLQHPAEDHTTQKLADEVVAESQPRTIIVDEQSGQDGQVHELASEQSQNHAESSEIDAAGSDMEESTRSRQISDPISGRSSSIVRSPTFVHDGIESVTDLTSELSIPEHRKNAWFKYLAEFWSKRTASGWANLEYPLHSNEHVFEDLDIIVREDEPSSIIAIALACPDYRNKVNEFRNHSKRHPPQKVAQHAPASNSGDLDCEGGKAEIEASLLSESGTHMKYSFSHGTFKASCKIFYAESFDALRRRCGVAERFIESMSRCLKFDSKGGKTKSLFLRTLDGRFMIKSLQEVELKAFTKFAPDYFAFMSYALFHGVPSVIAKMFGLFQINIRNPATGVDFSYYLLVMENLFYERSPNRRFDLKGSMRNRKIESTGEADEVLLDENLVETIFESPLFVREHSRKLLQASVFNDTLWLCKQNVMDYSLMAGFDDTSKELVVGIIDCIRTYTWDKKLESWIKDRGKNKPTITSPKDYRNRFRVSMMQYVLQAPNCWHQFQANMAPPKTLQDREDRQQHDDTEDTEMERV